MKNKSYKCWFRVTKGDEAVSAIVRAETLENAILRLREAYPVCEVVSLSEDTIEII